MLACLPGNRNVLFPRAAWQRQAPMLEGRVVYTLWSSWVPGVQSFTKWALPRWWHWPTCVYALDRQQTAWVPGMVGRAAELWNEAKPAGTWLLSGTKGTR